MFISPADIHPVLQSSTKSFLAEKLVLLLEATMRSSLTDTRVTLPEMGGCGVPIKRHSYVIARPPAGISFCDCFSVPWAMRYTHDSVHRCPHRVAHVGHRPK